MADTQATPFQRVRQLSHAAMGHGSAPGIVAYRAAIIHSSSMTTLDMLPDALLVVDHSKGGIILDLIDVEHQAEDKIAEVARGAKAVELVHLCDRILIPGFVDTHAHAPQYAFTGTGMHLPLLKWLETYTFPCEARFADLEFAREIYTKSVNRHLKNGTTTCSYFATLHLEASKMLVDIVKEQGQRAYVGKVSMDRNSPDFYVEKTDQGIKDAHEFVRYTQGKMVNAESLGHLTDGESPDSSDHEKEDGESTAVSSAAIQEGLEESKSPELSLVTAVVTPRFVPSCTPEMLKALGDLSRAYNLPVQSHLSESPGEVAWVRELHPECSSYTDVYRSFGLLHERAYFAHCCHCGTDEQELLKLHEAGVAHCPSSNFMLGSGVLNVRRLLRQGVKVGLGTDVAGGYSTSVLDAVRQAIIASRCVSFTERDEEGNPYEALSIQEVFYLATQGGANVLGLGDQIGNFAKGKIMDAVVVDAKISHGPLDLFDGESLHSAFEKFLFLGDDRNIEQVFVGGKRVL